MELVCRTKNIYKILSNFDREFNKRNGITLNEAIVLVSLANDEGCCAGHLSNTIGVSNSRTYRVLLGDEEKGYIMRIQGEKDKKQMFFTLTIKGEQKLAKIHDQKNECLKFINSLVEHIDE